jgi:hypothetical protein
MMAALVSFAQGPPKHGGELGSDDGAPAWRWSLRCPSHDSHLRPPDCLTTYRSQPACLAWTIGDDVVAGPLLLATPTADQTRRQFLLLSGLQRAIEPQIVQEAPSLYIVSRTLRQAASAPQQPHPHPYPANYPTATIPTAFSVFVYS